MPLIKSKSPKAFKKNVEIEMEAGKPQDQSLAIAYSVKRKAKKKMAEGGAVSAANEKRPMPSEKANDSAMVDRNSGQKPPHQDSWTDKPTERQALSNNGRAVKPIKHPKMVPSDAFSTRLRNDEDHLQDSASPGPYGAQPQSSLDEEGADRQGPKVRDMAPEHSTGKKPYAKGGRVESSDYSHPHSKYEDDLLDLPPSHDEGASMAHSHNEEGPDRQGPAVHIEDEHSLHGEMYDDAMGQIDSAHQYAEGGSIHDEDELEHAASIAAAIMAKRRRMARGGAILSEDSMETSESDQADLARNAEEDANMEDKASFDALRKENYSESAGLAKMGSPRDSNQSSPEHDPMDINDADIVSAIRRKMRNKSPISR